MPKIPTKVRNPVHEQAIAYLFKMGYGKDSISLILKGAVTSGEIARFLKEHNLKRSFKEASEMKRINKINVNAGYEEIKARVKLLFPNVIS